MKIIKICSIVVVLFCATMIGGKVASAEEDIVNREEKIESLLDERQQLLMKNDNGVMLEKIEKELSDLGVEFLTYEEVVENYSDIVDENWIQGNNRNAMARVVVPSSTSKNSYVSYRSKYNYGGKVYDIQKITVQPISEESNLWREGARTIKLYTDWIGAGEAMLNAVASVITDEITDSLENTIVGKFISKAGTVYEVLSAGWDALQKESEVVIDDITYIWQSQTTAIFVYVKLDGQDDDEQFLSHIATRCVTDVACVVSIPKWIKNEGGNTIIYPNVQTGDKTFRHTPDGYYQLSRAIEGYENWYTVRDCIDEIAISGPEMKKTQYIYPCVPLFPAHCE